MEKEMKVCKVCFKEKELNEFHKNIGLKSGYESRCKDCKLKKLKIKPKGQTRKPKPPHLWTDDDLYNMSGLNKEQYIEMWNLLSVMGYDVTESAKTIHEQFIEKHNKNGANMKPKKRLPRHHSKYLWNGEINPKYKYAGTIK